MKNRIICWGAGKQALAGLLQVEELYDIKYIVDKRQLGKVLEYTVYRPEKIAEDIEQIDYVFIMTYIYWFDVYKECIKMGVKTEKIRYWDIDLKRAVEIEEMYQQSIHSGNGEEIYLKNIFAGKENGVYVDVGAFHPMRVSNTLWAYRKGWRGINIEPNMDNMEYFKILRPEDKNVNCGISDVVGEMTYYMLDDGAYNTFDYELLMQDNLTDRIVKEEKVPVRRLEDVLRENNVREVDFLDIDVEGHEMNVLRGIDFSVDIKVILVEQLYMSLAEVVQSEPYQFLKEKGYEAVVKFGETVIYKKQNEG
ncbi:MAG: FkbM family methyltransferase [Lachnospiraceae bacterium]|nr:FkbM family methyltransferase [Lachnospiraceae bacterium]